MKTLKKFKKLSSLLKASLEDAAKAKATGKYKFDMDIWHEGAGGGRKKCAICQAGATIAMRLGVDIREDIGPCNFDNATDCKLTALDSLRTGRVKWACNELGIKWNEDLNERFPDGRTTYATFGDSYTSRYVKQMNRLVLELKAAGL